MARKKNAARPEFPEQIYVTRDSDDPEILYTGETTEGVENGESVGVYSLRQVLTNKIYAKLE